MSEIRRIPGNPRSFLGIPVIPRNLYLRYCTLAKPGPCNSLPLDMIAVYPYVTLILRDLLFLPKRLASTFFLEISDILSFNEPPLIERLP